MKTPKILPWLARRTGVSDERAEDLWRAACQQATALTGERDGPCYWGAAVQTLLDLLEAERWKAGTVFVWPWLLLPYGIEQWSLLARRWLAPSALLRVRPAADCCPMQVGGAR